MAVCVESRFLSRPLILEAGPHPRAATETRTIKLQPPDSPPSPASHTALLTALGCSLIAHTPAGKSCLYMVHDLKEGRLT